MELIKPDEEYISSFAEAIEDEEESNMPFDL